MLSIFPRDEQGLFEAPVVTMINAAANALSALVAPDPDRALIILSNTGATICFFAPTGTGGAGKGFALFANSAYPVILDHNTHGPLVQAGWDVYNNGVLAPVSAITVALRRDPVMYGFGKAFLRREANTLALPVQPSLVKPRSRRVISLPPAVLAVIRSKCPRILGEG